MGNLTVGQAVVLSCLSIPACAIAQITPDATLPTNSTITSTGCVICTINGGTVQGQNLFHSFSRFSIPNGGVAYFNNSTNVQLIISRVTGSNASTIDGLIRANGLASLIFINSNGITFGANARLQIGGSFLASTADRVLFSDGVQFTSKSDQSPPLLTISAPIGLGFTNPGAIEVQGQGHNLVAPSYLAPPLNAGQNPGLTVRPGQTLALIGGDIALNGGVLNAPSGKIEMASVAVGIVGLTPTPSSWTFDYRQVSGFSNLLLTQRSLADTSGVGNGSTGLQAKNIRIERGSVLLNFSTGALPNGTTSLNASETISISGTDPIARSPGGILLGSGSKESSGDINISSLNFRLEQGGIVVTESLGRGQAGDIWISTPGELEIDGVSPVDQRLQSTIVSLTTGTGNAGNVRVAAGTLRITGGGFLESATYSTGQGGAVWVNASESVELTGVAEKFLQPSLLGSTTLGAGNAGSVTVQTPVLTVRDGGRLDSSTQGAGDAGSVFVNATRRVEVTGRVSESRNPSLISSSGAIADPQLQQIFGLPLIPTGAAGDVRINTPQLRVSEGGQISVRNEGIGDAGTVFLNADRIQVESGGALTAQTDQGQGGNLKIEARQVILRRGAVVANANTQGNGGNIRVNSAVLALLDGSEISANAGQGLGGQISITAQGLFRSPASIITATSDLGLQFNGVVQLNAPEVDLVRATAAVPVVTDPPPISSACGGQAARTSSFTQIGTGGLPTNPEQQQSSQRGWQESEPSQVSMPPSTPAIVEAQGWVQNSDGSIQLVADAASRVPVALAQASSCLPTATTVIP
jgi:filamentous hemagglutinin family protein